MRKVVYTCIVGDYDDIVEPKYVTEDFDYICFTDSQQIKSDIWQIKPLPKGIEDLDNAKKQRFVKLLAHKILPSYDLSIYVDGNVLIQGDLNEFLKENCKEEDGYAFIPKHPLRNCIYDEANVVVRIKKDKGEIVNKQINRYKKEGFPSKLGLTQNSIIIRKHNDENCIRLMEAWFDEVKNESHRDQLSLYYSIWKLGDVKIYQLDKNICDSKWFKWLKFHKKKTSQKMRLNSPSNVEKKTDTKNNIFGKEKRTPNYF